MGPRGFGPVNYLNFRDEFRKTLTDELDIRERWTGCSGDIATISWVSNDGFICGATAHSDAHNQQYNKPGNLVLGSTSQGTLKAYADHRIVRPIVTKGENASAEMRHSLDPWLYCSVVSTDFDARTGRAFTSSFDRTVKIWRPHSDGSSMDLLGTWQHSGNVNFVLVSPNQAGLVATAADVGENAVRVYHVGDDDSSIPYSTFDSYNMSRKNDPSRDWALFPAAMQWGRTPDVSHLLLVGYSPRSYDGLSIPEARLNNGEIKLWDCLKRRDLKVNSASAANVFEVAWHPSQPCFIAATAAFGLEVPEGVRTQIRIFRPVDDCSLDALEFSQLKTLDCYAADINELSIL